MYSSQKQGDDVCNAATTFGDIEKVTTDDEKQQKFGQKVTIFFVAHIIHPPSMAREYLPTSPLPLGSCGHFSPNVRK